MMAVIDLALKEPELPPRELATAFIGQSSTLSQKPRSIGCWNHMA